MRVCLRVCCDTCDSVSEGMSLCVSRGAQICIRGRVRKQPCRAGPHGVELGRTVRPPCMRERRLQGRLRLPGHECGVAGLILRGLLPACRAPSYVCTGRVRLGWRAWFVAAAWAASATNWWGRVACCDVVVVADKTRGPRGLCAASLAMTVRARPPRGGGGGGRSGGICAGGPAVSMLHRGPVSERDGFTLLHSTAVMGSYSFSSPKLRLPAPAVGAAISASSD